MKPNRITSAKTKADNSTNVEDTSVSQTIAKPNVSGSFSKSNMISFAHYLRNGLTNLEYCQKELEEHFEYWCQNYR